MISKESRMAIQNLCKGGAMRPISEVADDLKHNLNSPSFNGNSDLLVYEAGEHNGIKKGIDMLVEEILNCGKPNEFISD